MEILITKEELKKLNENDLMFITIPGRMGDIYGCTFVIIENNKYIFYRIDNMYKYFNILCEVFPILNNDLKKASKRFESNKYKYLYMGMGNGLCIDKNIYDKYIYYLMKYVKKSNLYNGEKEFEYQPCINYEVWKTALKDMINN